MVSRRQAINRGWEGPYRYHSDNAHAQNIIGWIVKRGRKWLYFYSNTDRKMLKLPLEHERDLVSVDRRDSAKRTATFREESLTRRLDQALARNDEDEVARLDLEIKKTANKALHH